MTVTGLALFPSMVLSAATSTVRAMEERHAEGGIDPVLLGVGVFVAFVVLWLITLTFDRHR